MLERNLLVVSDEIYERLIYGDNRFASFPTVRPGLAERTIVVNGVSKSYAMTGWRIGWTLSPANVAKAMADLQSQETSNPCSISQYAALAALEGPQQCVDEMLAEFAKRREFVNSGSPAIPKLSCAQMGGAFYAFVNIREHLGRSYGGMAGRQLAQWCLALAGSAERGHRDGLGLRRRGLRPNLVCHEPGNAEGRLRPDRGVSQQPAVAEFVRIPISNGWSSEFSRIPLPRVGGFNCATAARRASSARLRRC